MQLAFYKITTPDEKKGLQLIALLSKEDLSSKDHEERRKISYNNLKTFKQSLLV